MVARQILLILIVFFLSSLGCRRQDDHALRSPLSPTAATNADELLRRVETVYAAAGSYRDRGVVISTFSEPRVTNRRPFATAFQRDRLFRFEFTDRFIWWCTRFVVWSTGQEVYSWWTIHPIIDRHKSIADAIAGPTGISGGSAHTIPTLLLGRKGSGWRITDLREPQLIGIQALGNGETCYVIRGKHPRAENIYTLWISQRSFAIHRIYGRSRLDDGTDVTDTTIYAPAFDVAIDEKTIPFHPPPEGESGCERSGLLDRLRLARN